MLLFGPTSAAPALLAIAAQPINAQTSAHVAITLAWTGVAPSSFTSATWNHSGGSATITGFTLLPGGWITVFATTPSSANATYQLQLTANTGAVATTANINVAAATSDASALPPGVIYGPTAPVYGQDMALNNDNGYIPIASYFGRGLSGPVTATLTGVDAIHWTLSPAPVGHYPFANGFVLVPQSSAFGAAQTTFSVTINMTDGVNTLTPLNVTVQNPANTGGTVATIAVSNNLVLDSQTSQLNRFGQVSVANLWGSFNLTGFTFTPDSGNLFSLNADDNIQIAAASLTSANFGVHNTTITPTGGTPVTVPFYIGHESPPVVAYVPNGPLTSATPPTNNQGSNQIGAMPATADSGIASYGYTSNPSGALSTYNVDPYFGRTGLTYLQNSVSAGTLSGTCLIASTTGLTTSMALTLPVVAGTLYSSSDISGSVTAGLTNFLPTALAYNPTGAPTTVLTASCSAFTPNWSLTTLDVIGDNCQLTTGYVAGTSVGVPYTPRYALVPGVGGAFTVTAWNLSAINETTPQIDDLQVTLTDGNGNYCIATFNISTSWHPYTGAALSCGPGGTWTTATAMGEAIVASPATYAGATVKLLKGLSGFGDWTFNLGARFTTGWLPCPLHLIGDASTQATFTGSVSGNTLTVSSSAGLAVGQLIITGATNCVLVTQVDGTHWTVNGSPQTVTSTTMTAQNLITLDFEDTAPGGGDGQQGGLMAAGGYDLNIERIEITRVSNGSNAAAIYKTIQQAGNLTVKNCYIHNSNNGVLGGDNGTRNSLIDNLFAANGAGSGNSHNIYLDPAAYVTVTGNYSVDSLGHEFKCRAMGGTVTGNFFLEGPNYFGFDSVADFPSGGNYTFDDNVVMKGANDAQSSNGGMIDWTSEIIGQPCWPVSTLAANANTIINTIDLTRTAPTQPPRAWSAFYSNVDPVRLLPITVDLTNNEYYNLPEAQWYSGQGGATAPVGGAGEATITDFPFAGIYLIYPLIGGPPLNLPLRGSGQGTSIGALGNAPGSYAMVLTVPTGSGSGTQVIGGNLAGYDSASPTSNQLTGISASVTGSFATTVTGNDAQLSITNSPADGIYYPEVTISGTGTAPLPGAQYFAAIVGTGDTAPTCTLNPARVGSNMTLSNGNLTWTGSSGADSSVFGTLGYVAGTGATPANLFLYFEVTPVSIGSSLGFGVGIANQNATVSECVGQDTNGICLLSHTGQVLIFDVVATYFGITTSDTLGVAVDFVHQKVWWTKNGTTWNNDIITNQNPATNTGGSPDSNQVFETIGSFNTIYPAFGNADAGNEMTANFGATPFVFSPPAGFSAWAA